MAIPGERSIAPKAEIANSVALQVQYGLTYTPEDLALKNEALGEGFLLVTV